MKRIHKSRAVGASALRTPTGGALICAAAVAAAFLAGPAHATNGYFSHGYGLKAKGMGGVAVARTDDAFGGANNPATMVFAGDRLDVGLDWFSPKRAASRTGSIGGTVDFSVDSDSTNFFSPEFGYNRMLSPDMSFGVTVYGNGGMNTDYPGGVASCGQPGRQFNALCGVGRLGVDLSQLIIAPTFAMKLDASHAIGVAPLLAYQRFKAEGLQAFDNAPGFPPFTGSPGNVTNRGYDASTGWGVRVGYAGRLSEALTIGAAYSTKLSMGKFDKYKGLFAENGGFDIPGNYGVGIVVTPDPKWQIGLDYQRITYSDVPSVHNPSSNQAPLGAANGPGFGWQDINVIKLGVQWKSSDTLTLRAGYDRCDNPIRASDITFNIIAPGVIKEHYTLGMTWAQSKTSEITVAYMYAKKNSVTGPSFFNSPALFGPGNGGTERIEMYQNSLGVAWSMKF